MDEYKFKKNLTVHLGEEIKEELSEFMLLTGREYQFDSEILRELMDAAFSRKKPKEVEKPENIAKIKELIAQVKGLQDVNATFTTDVNELKEANDELIGNIDDLKDINAELSAKVNELQNTNTNLSDKVNGLQNVNANLTENQYIVELSPFRKELFTKYLKSKEAIAIFSKNNQNGKADGMADIINTDNERANMANFLTTVATGSAYGKVLINLFSKEQINTAFDKSKKEAENAG